MRKLLQSAGLAVAAASLFFGLLPLLLYGIFHTGVAALLLFGLLLAVLCLFWDPPKREAGTHIRRRLRLVSDRRRPPIPHRWKTIRAIGAAGISVCMLGAAAVSVLMLSAAFQPIGQETRTVIVLGCQIIGDQPSRMLSYRLDAAERYLKEYPDASAVVSGGRSPSETYSEAEVMKNELVKRGIDAARIYTEDRSANTEENIRFSEQVISENNLSGQAAIATDSFHQLRAAVYARRAGLSPAPLDARTLWGLLPSYWVREFFALAKAILFS